MGLDWMVHKRKPKLGFDLLFDEIESLIEKTDEDSNEYTRLTKEIEEISVSAFEEIGCPRIGIDKEATVWWDKNVYAPSMEKAKKMRAALPHTKPPKNEWETKCREHDKEYAKFWLDSTRADCLAKAKGRYVTDLAKTSKGKARVSGMMCSDLDFRGKMMRYIEDLDEDLVNEAWEDHTADECVDYANRLEGAKGGICGKDDLAKLESAIQWLRFWGNRGFGYWAWY